MRICTGLDLLPVWVEHTMVPVPVGSRSGAERQAFRGIFGWWFGRCGNVCTTRFPGKNFHGAIDRGNCRIVVKRTHSCSPTPVSLFSPLNLAEELPSGFFTDTSNGARFSPIQFTLFVLVNPSMSDTGYSRICRGGPMLCELPRESRPDDGPF